MNNFDLIVFDWDGTLMDSQAKIIASYKAACVQVGAPLYDDARYRNVIGLGLIEATERLYPEHDHAFHQQLADAYRQSYLYADQTPQPLFAGAEETLRWFAQRDKLLAVATGKSRRGLQHVLAHSGLGAYFHATRCADESLSKPAPNMLLEILDELGVAADRALLVGDTDFDLQMAANAGVSSVAVTCGAHDEAQLLAHAPLACLPTVADLPGWFSGSTHADEITL